MRDILEYYEIPVEQRQVDVVHILNDGKLILTKKELELVKDKFSFVNPQEIVGLILQLRPQTDSNRKSIIVIYESGDIKTHPNISKNFTKYNLLNKSSL